jgi:CelD/BcsL family acetyltransferase involved in cellulose biosynthesis
MSAATGEIIRTAAALEAIEPAWWELWRRARTATPFQSPAWLIPWWRHFAPGELTTAAAWRDGRLIGLAPFYREDGALGRRLLPLGISVSDYLDVLLDDGEAEAAAALVAALDRAPAWDSLECEELAPDAAAIAEGAGEFHFLRGREAYKYEWGAVDRWNFRRAAAERSVA